MHMQRWTPGEVVSYDAAEKIVRVRFPGLGENVDPPEAMLCLPVGDKSHHTDIRILPGDRVWLDFIGGDPRFPIILGYRPAETGGAVDVRRWHHKAIELTADTDVTIEGAAGTVLIKAGTAIRLQAPAITLDGQTTVTGRLIYQDGIEGHGAATSNGKNVSDTHTHKGVKGGPDTSGPVS